MMRYLSAELKLPVFGRGALVCFVLSVLVQSQFALAQATQAGELSQNQRQSITTTPDENVLARLVWSTMISLDNANRTGNYQVLHALGSPSFKASNSPSNLAETFAPLRQARIDVGRAILITPTYYLAPTLDTNGNLRLRGAFEYRPQSLRFDIIYQNVGGGWRIHAISVAQMDATAPRE